MATVDDNGPVTFGQLWTAEIIAAGGGNITGGCLGENEGDAIFCTGLIGDSGDITNSGTGDMAITSLVSL